MTSRDEVLAALATLGPGSADAVTLLGHVRDLATFADQVQGELARLIHLLGWTVSGDPNGTLRFTHPNGYLTLDSPLPSQTNLAP